MSEVIDSAFTAEVRDELLAEIREHLPAFLHRGATEQHDPIGDVRELLNLEQADLSRVISVHLCLDPVVLELGAALREGLRRPIASSVRPPELTQSVRGPVDWSATTGRRALEAGNPSLFVVRPARRLLDTAENRALAWLLERLEVAASEAMRLPSAGAEDVEPTEDGNWSQRIELLRSQLREGRRVHWLRGVTAEAPTPATLSRLRAARNGFYSRRVAAAIEAVLRLADPSAEVLTEVLTRRYFRPEETWRLFEVAVALRLARAFSAQSPRDRRARLLVGNGRAAFARYWFEDGAEIALIYQAWPRKDDRSLRRQTGDRHGLSRSSSRPDLFIVRSGPDEDAVLLELKATYSAGYLNNGLLQLLGYIGERPDLWRGNPAGWLVAPASDAFEDASADPSAPLWMISAERVGEAAVSRLLARPEAPHG